MTKEELHTFLTNGFDLVVDPSERGNGRTYFLRKVLWHPSQTTRILHVQYGVNDQISHIKLCVSSDNNNSVFVPLPTNWVGLRRVVSDELSLHAQQRRSPGLTMQ
ncbi:hypothetical protein DIE19_02775 [Burkholderia sp. Bp9126]|nr:hypothetical protein DIE19_02775 [Burkholderia sp. Bp9126]